MENVFQYRLSVNSFVMQQEGMLADFFEHYSQAIF